MNKLAYLAAAAAFVLPDGNGGYTVMTPATPEAPARVESFVLPDGNGGYTVMTPATPGPSGSLNPAHVEQFILPNGNGGFTVIEPAR